MTARSLALRLLRFIGVTSLDPAANETSLLKRGIDENDLAEVATCITAALQEVFADAPGYLSEQAVGGVLRPPETIRFDATQYSEALTEVTAEPWMLGCTIRVSGEALDNRIVRFEPALVRISTSNVSSSSTIAFGHLIGKPLPVAGSIVRCQNIDFTVSNVASTGPLNASVHDAELTLTVTPSAAGLAFNSDVFLMSATGSATLMRPYMGSTGSATATVYADCIPMASNVKNVLEPVAIPNRPKLAMAGSVEEFRRGGGCATQYGFGLDNKSIGEPVIAFADSHFDITSAHLPLFLRFNPMPGQAYPVTYRIKLKPPTITAAMIDSGDHVTDPLQVIPVDWVESIVLPFALQRWSAHPSFSADSNQLSEIGRQYTMARRALLALKPQISRTRAIWAQG